MQVYSFGKKTNQMYKVSYKTGSTIVESFLFHNIALAKWKKNEMVASGRYKSGEILISKQK